MRSQFIATSLWLFGVYAVSASAVAADKPDIGKQQYNSSCASCHGASGKGDGPVRAYLNRPPLDLTVLSKNNGGVFPLERVIQVIDGRAEVRPHGSREMPVWGTRFSLQAGEYYVDAPYESEAYVRARILVLADYLNRLQVR